MIPLLFAALVSAEPSSLHVQASLLNARSAPDGAAPIEAWLRIGTEVETLEERGDWVRVRVVGRPEDHAVDGWVLGRFLDVRRPHRNELTGDRLAALDGLGNPGPAHVAVCDGSRVDYLGYFDGEGEFVDRSSWEAPVQDLMDLSALHWTETRPDGRSMPIVGSPFVKPFLTEDWNEDGGSAWGPGSCEELCGQRDHVVLGPCSAEGAVYTTRPAYGSLEVDGELFAVQKRFGGQPYQEVRWRVRSPGWEAEILVDQSEMGDDTPFATRPTTWVRTGKRTLGISPIRRPTHRGWLVVEAEEQAFRYFRAVVEGWGC